MSEREQSRLGGKPVMKARRSPFYCPLSTRWSVVGTLQLWLLFDHTMGV